MDAYQDAASIWNHKIQFSRVGLKKEFGHGDLIARYNLPLDNEEKADCDIAMQLLWALGAKRLADARAAVAGEPVSPEERKRQEESLVTAAARQTELEVEREAKSKSELKKLLDTSRAETRERLAKREAEMRDAISRWKAREFVGRWKLVDENGTVSSYLTVTRDFRAKRDHAPDSPGTWVVVDKEARFTWEDGIRDVMRSENGRMTYLGLGKATVWDSPPNFRCRVVRIAN
jgi:hypothetical protein